MEAEALLDEFMQAVEHGREMEEARKAYAVFTGMIAAFYEGLKGAGLPEPLVYVLTCNFAAQVVEALILRPIAQAQVGKEGNGDGEG